MSRPTIGTISTNLPLFNSMKNPPPFGWGQSVWQGATGLDLHFRPGMGENDGIHQCLRWWMQQSTGLLRLDLFESRCVVDSKK